MTKSPIQSSGDLEPVSKDLSHEVLIQAQTLLKSKRVILSGWEEESILTGRILPAHSSESVKILRIGLRPDGTCFLPQGSKQSPFCATDVRAVDAVALVLKLGVITMSDGKGHQSAEHKRILSQAPQWLARGRPIQLPVELGDPNAASKFSNLQAYQVLRGMVDLPGLLIEPDVLVNQVMNRYADAEWGVKKAAMEAVLRRFDSVRSEKIRLLQKPAESRVVGFYRVQRGTSKTQAYPVLLAETQPPHGGIEGSCGCPDFLKNTLGICKHLAAVVAHWHSSRRLVRRFAEEKPAWHARVAWCSETGLSSIPDPVLGIHWMDFDNRNQGSRFSGLKREISTVLALRRGRQGSPNERHEILKQLLGSIKKETNAKSGIIVDPAIEPLLEREIRKLDWPCQYPTLRRALLAETRKLRFRLYDYQKQGIEKALERGNLLLADDMGLGKTVQAIAWAEALLGNDVVKKVLLICPAALKSQWQREWQGVSGRRIQIVEGSPEDRKRFYRAGEGVFAVNYELLLRDIREIEAFSPDAVILDEAQRIKNYATATAKQVKKLNPRFKLVLTGTPMENRIQELTSLMEWVEDGVMSPPWRLGAEHAIGEGSSGDHARRGVKGLEILRERLAPYFLRRKRAEVLDQLPPRTDSPLFLEMTGDQEAIHAEYAKKSARLAKIAEVRPLTPVEHLRLMQLLLKMRVVSNALAQHDFEAIWPSLAQDRNPLQRLPHLCSPKLQEFRNLIEGVLSQPGTKIVVFSQWERMLRLAHWAVSDLLCKQDIEAVFFTGQESQRRRTENVVRFHDDPDVRLFFSTDAGGVGLNLQKAAQVCINLELPWNPAVLEQRIGRVYRLGQNKPVQIYNLITQGSIEERIKTLVSEKQAVFQGLFDGTSDEVVFGGSGNFYSQVREVMEEVCPESPEETGSDDFEVESASVESMGSEEESNCEPASDPQKDPVNFADSIQKAFRQVRIQKTDSGGIRLEAEGDSAQLLAGMFRGMADIFEGASRRR